MMTTVSLKDALLDSAREVFETMVFMAMEEASEDTTSLGDTTLLGSITFKGHLEGCLGVCCDETCARTIASNMLGMLSPEEVSENDISDAMGEIANMVMGAVKARIQGEVGTVEVSIPSVVQGRELKNSLGEGSGQVKVRVSIEEQYRAEFSLLYREGNPS
ncbi:MAG: chemotaxis protein CheX [Phycisphaerae bacterium]|nr:chemotaxis protein CheX [Phycisphaerae bacterium]